MKHESNCDICYNPYTWNGPKRFGKKTGGSENTGRIDFIQNPAILKSARIFRRVPAAGGSVTQTQMKYQQLLLM